MNISDTLRQLMKKIFVNLLDFASNDYQILEHIPMEISIYDNRGRYKFMNSEYLADRKLAKKLIGKDDAEFSRKLGISEHSLKKRRENLQRVIETGNSVRFTEKLYFPEKNRYVYYKRILQPQFSPKSKNVVKEIILYGHNLSSIMHAQRELKYLVYHDQLTGLRNRTAFFEQLDQLITDSNRRDPKDLVAILICDIDHFKELNESSGHEMGDILLREIARRIKQTVRESDMVFRIGGDEFAIILKNLNHDHDASRVAEKIIRELSVPYHISQKNLNYLTISMGISLYPKDGQEREILVKKSSNALKSAKKVRRNEYQFFSEEVTEKTMKRLEMEHNLRMLVDENGYEKQFEILYQPVVEKMISGDYRIIGCEALLRWHNPDVGSVSPTVFIPIAEESELICPIGDWVLYKAINDFKTLVKTFNRPLYLSINLSAIQMKSPDLIQNIEKIIHHTDVEPHDLHLELTETSFLDESIQVVQNLDAIENLGIKIDIDDFGVGFASLKYLQKFPVSSIKIDRSFIQHLNFNSEHKKLVESIILLGKNLKKDIIAEGVENLEHLYMLYTQKCYKYQGYLFSKPVPLGKFERLLHEEQTYRDLKASMGKDPKMDKLLKTEFN